MSQMRRGFKSNFMKKPDTILILDFGGQYCHLIARRIRQEKVFSHIVSPEIGLKEIEKLKEKLNIKGVIFSGGPFSVYEKRAIRCKKEILNLNLPILGICYGHQLLAFLFGGKIKAGKVKEYGIVEVKIKKKKGILRGLKNKEKVLMSHKDKVKSLPKDFEILASTETTEISAFSHKSKPIFGVQWHPEVSHTRNGQKIFKNFLFEICKCKRNWKIEEIIEKAIEEIRETVGKEKAIIALSGGIDSSTSALLGIKAIGENLTAVFVDHGFLREGEPETVRKFFEKQKINFVFQNERERFLKKLKGIISPERKRKIIGREFIRVFERVAQKIKAKYLIQGTIYPDRIESGIRKFSEKIKTHHNVGGIPSKIRFKKIIEPLRELYKDEVREIAKKLGLKEEILSRQPFPGPGLAIRIIGAVDERKIRILKKADKIIQEEIEKTDFKKKLWQYFPVFLDLKTTGIKGDKRAVGYVIALRAVESEEAMTADFAKLPYSLLEKISHRITNEIPQIMRVVYDITSKPPATIEWE